MRKVAILLVFAIFSAGVISCGQVSSQRTYEGAAVGGAVGAAAGALIDKEQQMERSDYRWCIGCCIGWNYNGYSSKGCKGSSNG
jgi:hypothetical protein